MHSYETRWLCVPVAAKASGGGVWVLVSMSVCVCGWVCVGVCGWGGWVGVGGVFSDGQVCTPRAVPYRRSKLDVG
jgi:hypothetical protein